ncbi:RES domain-containing protein [Thermoanaerobacter siderophilus]|nr:RES domain-containing protein [Thermoanaerobacter siderophilus]
MNEYESASKLWKSFKEEIMYNNRFFPSNKELIKKLNDTLSKLSEMASGRFLTRGDFYRARIGKFDKEEDIRKPDPKKVPIGDQRCNPRGISYFYVAGDPTTAIYEIKPEIDEIVTIGKFKIKNPLDLKICYLNMINIPESNPIKELALSEEERCLLKIILKEISKPLNSQETLGYIPIQYIVEYIKNKSFDGFVFDSSLKEDGKNYVFFDDSKFEFVSIKHVKIKK